jgi:hypothetical protein
MGNPFLRNVKKAQKKSFYWGNFTLSAVRAAVGPKASRAYPPLCGPLGR